MKRIYAIVISLPKDNEKTYFVKIPDLELFTQGDDLSDAIRMARDVIGLWGITQEDLREEIPQAKNLKFPCDEGEICTLVEVDFSEYRKQEENRMVRRNCTIPYWLDKKASEKKINVSAVLQEALKAELKI